MHGGGRVKFAGIGKCDESSWITGIKEICRIFDVPDLKDDQKMALRSLFEDRNIYFSAPTGYGKSLVFQSIPILADHLLNRPLFTSIVLVISPLISLMLDQVKYLESKGLSAVAISSEDDITKDTISSVKEGLFNFVYASPESMLSVKKWRDILTSDIFKEYCICVVFDEAHCISQW